MVKKLCLGVVLFFLLVAGITQPQQEEFMTTVPVKQLQEVCVWWTWHGNLYSMTYDTISWETLLVMFDNGDWATLTGFFTTIIPVNAALFASMCTHYGKDVSEIVTMIHNHILPSGFSLGDIRFYEDLKRYGFQGQYLLYSPGQRIREYTGDHTTIDLKKPYKKEEVK